MQHAHGYQTDLAASWSWPAKEDVKKQTNADGAIPVCALCDSRLPGLIPLPDLINHAAGIEKRQRGT
jgi:hypothetical protein